MGAGLGEHMQEHEWAIMLQEEGEPRCFRVVKGATHCCFLSEEQAVGVILLLLMVVVVTGD